jgi:hypothetical protein
LQGSGRRSANVLHPTLGKGESLMKLGTATSVLFLYAIEARFPWWQRLATMGSISGRASPRVSPGFVCR